jgi:hypothetical protein
MKKLRAEATICSHILGIELKKALDISMSMCFLRYAACPIYVSNTEGNKPKVKLSWKTKTRFLITMILMFALNTSLNGNGRTSINFHI